jgi:phospholipid/cholesterol/gamma-HCH transport system permease protein
MPTNSPLDAAVFSPLGWIGRAALAGSAYVGGLTTLTASAAACLIRPADGAPPFFPALSRQVTWILGMAVPLVAVVHIGLGSFLSMQAYFGGTFVDGTGAVVGVGLIRNVAPMMTGLTLAGLFAAAMTADVRNPAADSSARDPSWVPDRGALPGPRAEQARPVQPARLAAVRLAAAVIVGPALTIWAVLVGTLVGWQVAKNLLGVSTESFFFMFTEMLWIRDIVGLVIKGTAFSFFAALLACREGLQTHAEDGLEARAAAACRAACWSAVVMLAINSAWFLLFYHAGPAFGPTLLAPPAP